MVGAMKRYAFALSLALAITGCRKKEADKAADP